LEANDDLGYAVVALAPFVDAKGDFDVPIMLNGRPAGSFKGVLQFMWPKDGKFDVEERSLRREEGCCTSECKIC